MQILRLYIKPGPLIEYSMQYPINCQLIYDEEYINFDGTTIVKPKLIDEKGFCLTYLEDFESWNEQTKEIIGSSKITYVHPSNESVIAEIGTQFDCLGPIESTSKFLMIEDLLNDRFTKLIIDGNKLI